MRFSIVSLFFGLLAMPLLLASASQAAAETRSLKLYFIHTGEKAVITFKRNGKFDSRGLEQLNRFLRDWRRNQPTRMDPRLFDLIWEVYRKSGSSDYIHVVSAFRSPQTNSMLRSRSKAVAEKSQHMLGKAMDFYLPDVKLGNLRAIGMKMQVGGVGFYPNSGSPFVHMDVGNVRAWPRMSRQELVRLFPDGKTMHLPAEGTPLPGYQQAVAEYKRRAGSSSIEIADTRTTKRKSLFAALFGGGDENEEAVVAEEAVAAKTPQATRPVAEQPVVTAAADSEAEKDINAPVPLVRPAFREQPVDSGMAVALVPPTRNAAEAALQAASPADPQAEAQGETFADLKSYKVPVPSLLGKRPMKGDAEAGVLTASTGMPAEAVSDTVASELAAVPVPVRRPAVAEALLAKADAATESEADMADQATLSPGVVAALDQRGAAGRDNAHGAVSPEELAEGTDAEEEEDADGMAQVAALNMENKPAMRSAGFGDAFDQPQAHDSKTGAVAAGLPVKGARPKKQDAEAASRQPVRTEPKLTEQMISQWALSQARVEVQTKPVKAPRFVSRTLRAQPTEVYASGFTTTTASVDPGRFSGTAVNFLKVKKFDSAN